MSEPRPARRKGRSGWRWLLLGAFASSLLANLGLAAKIAVFDPNYPFRPICHGGRHVGLVVIQQPMNDRFKDKMRSSLWNSRLSRDDVLYIAYWVWRSDKENLWNVSRASAEHIYEKENGIKRMSQQERENLQTARCEFIRKYALRKPKSR